MKVCCGCKINTYDTYYPTTCKCLDTKLGNNVKDYEQWAKIAYEAGAHFCSLSQNGPNKCHFEGLCIGCWKKMFEPIYKEAEKSILCFKRAEKSVCFKRVDRSLFRKTSSGKCYRRYRKPVYVKHERSPKCQWCSIPYKVEKCDEMDKFQE